MIQQLKPFINGVFQESETETYTDVFNPSTGEVIARAPQCTKEEVERAIASAEAAYPAWRDTPAHKRAQLFFRLRHLLMEHLEELTELVARENGKNWKEAEGDVAKAIEMTEIATSIPQLLLGEALMNVSEGYDTTLYREPMGVFAGISPWNFPAMISMGWMAPLCIACGNTMVIKAASPTPMTSNRIAALYKEAGFPDGVLNVITTSRNEAEILLSHPAIRGVSFVGSTEVAKHIYATAASHGKRVQALGEAKNHALVLNDAPIVQTAAAVMNSAFGCAGERCMALPVLVVQEEIAEPLLAELKRQIQGKKVGAAYDKETDLGPVVTAKHKAFILDKIEKGLEEGATIALDGREVKVDGYADGFYIGHTILDHVTTDMAVGEEEIFGPVLSIKRVKDFEEGLAVMNANPFANGSVIFTQSGYYAREFAKRTDGGMVGINVGIPVPVGIFPFSGHKNSFFGDLHAHGKDAIRFYTESKTVTARWFSEEETAHVDSWDGSRTN